MKNETKKSGTERLKQALNELIACPTARINMNTVAKQAGVNHSLFRKAIYQEIKLEILTAQKIRDAERKNRSNTEQISALKTKLTTVNNKLERLKNEQQKPSSKTIKETEGVMIARLVEMYRFNDLLRAELLGKYGETIDVGTGEILKVNFRKD
ncbi:MULTISPECIES: hypothetical protein [Shewanella]|uniref:hypothetical protein n=1 Tax=Shewanella TaxID=22 RepID=UPI000849AB1D|nr:MULTISPECIES: hypothetical protein [Shewanella]MCU8022554.1 hypothetical protein [Shewanella sp. SM78]MCU8072111.1 hypothetical protein [Shewanella sp. SM32]MDV5247495.1 hypothetical protein [Shewanella xiamenensis]ODR84722.1 hypothetical protein ABT47_05020 [Shewanella xiamenensis]